ncbi:hypothetical protein B0J13DRAFT_564130 [Dactylonectria estremocensis]|uniref:Uncharacterized protein n=1 Tax=Dactylonectria estremocensis TaxID=1079267 RepID=A0A9P9ISI5_9HYPO|nr:hypothetical protein B0J13DRAFT_564130 [Dactylonectria estremocensis]
MNSDRTSMHPRRPAHQRLPHARAMNPLAPDLCDGMRHEYPSLSRGHAKPKILEPSSSQALPLPSAQPGGHGGGATSSYFEHSNGKRINTDSVVTYVTILPVVTAWSQPGP